jgi:hypothetical protein
MRPLALLLALLSASPALAANRKLAVLDLEAKGVDAAVTQTMTDVLSLTLKNLGVFDVVSHGEISQMLSFEQTKQLVGCRTSTSCIAELSGALGVARVVTGSIGRLGEDYVLYLVLIDSRTAQVVERESRTVKDVKELPQACEAAVRFLVRGMLAGRQGELVLRTVENGAEIEIDGKLVGIAPMPRLQMPSGPHTVRVSKTGFVTFAKDIILPEREAQSLEVALAPSPDFISGYNQKASAIRGTAWAAGAAGLAAIGASVGVWFGYNVPRTATHNAEKTALEQQGFVPPATQDRINARAADIAGVYTACEVIGAFGIGFVVASVVMFAVGPRPGAYDQFLTVEVGKAKLSLNFGPGGRLVF